MKHLILIIKKSIFALFMLILCLFSGCQTVLNKSDDLTNIAIANEMIMTGQVTETIKRIELNETELLTVNHAINKYSSFVSRWKESITDLDSTAPIFSEFMVDYSGLVGQYKAVESIVQNHLNVYSERDQLILLEYQRRARKMNDSVESLISAGNRYQALLDALSFGRIMIGLVQAL
ncbi:MAG: hypothetical protein IPP22_08755 [Nitrosomonas sp.]|nr:hypothetical protein [Nitrosomonas sp.]